MARDYVNGKKNSIKEKNAKALWHEQQVAYHTKKASDIRAEVKKDEKTLNDIASELARVDFAESTIESMKTKIPLAQTKEESDTYFAEIEQAQKQIVFSESRIRALYYGK